MFSFEKTAFWRSTLAARASDPDEEPRRRLREAFLAFRERADVLSAEISGDQRDLTVHDISHLDALWETATLVGGENYPLTPAEGFVLGGAFLTHDLAQSKAAYPRGLAVLREQPIWADTIASLLKQDLRRTPTADEILHPGDSVEERAVRVLLRELHAMQAALLMSAEWEADGVRYHLIESPELRSAYGETIGLIACSHWWPIEKLQDRTYAKPLGAPGGYPHDWHVDIVKLACLLRTADICQLDDRRAPGFLKALRKPESVSDDHWQFQQALNQPICDRDRVLYTSKRPFAFDEASAWWLGLESCAAPTTKSGRPTRSCATRAGRDWLFVGSRTSRALSSWRKSFTPKTGIRSTREST